MTLIRLLLLSVTAIVGIQCSSCNNDPRVTIGVQCWYDNWQARDARCGDEIGKEDDRRFSFPHKGSRCYCCPYSNEKMPDIYEHLNSPMRAMFCAKNCNACKAATSASECWDSRVERDEHCCSENELNSNGRFSFTRHTGDACYCCPV